MLLPAIGEHLIAEGRIPRGSGVGCREQRRANAAHLLPGDRIRAPLDKKPSERRRGLRVVPCQHHLSSRLLVDTCGRREAGDQGEAAQGRPPYG